MSKLTLSERGKVTSIPEQISSHARKLTSAGHDLKYMNVDQPACGASPEVMDFLQLKHLSNEYAGNLSGGQKKLLELGRTMMVKPKIVLLDEVGAGVNRTLLNNIGDAILRLNKELNYTFCMIEHDIEFISKLCNPVIVMAEGAILMEDTISKVKENEKVIEVYLGRS